MLNISKQKRDEAIYLIKKYTSVTLLEYSYNLKKGFLEQFEKLLRHPDLLLSNNINYSNKQLQHESEYINFLQATVAYEEQIIQLKRNNFKNEAYAFNNSFTFKDRLFGRYADENGLFEDEFYKVLGLGSESSGNIFFENDHTSFVRQVLISEQLNLAQNLTLYDFEYVIPRRDKIFQKWSFESLFNNVDWPLKHSFDDAIKLYLLTDDVRYYDVISGDSTTISGIYEPWFDQAVYEKSTSDPDYNPYVGCPNYFLAGAITTQYQVEGTDDWYNVKWRLIWEDNRYLDGTIPEEELAYTFDLDIKVPPNIPENNHEKLSIRAKGKVPQGGYWYTTAKETSRQYFKKGDIFPDIKNDWGEVYWYFDGEN